MKNFKGKSKTLVVFLHWKSQNVGQSIQKTLQEMEAVFIDWKST
jgi:hypothetical protein